MSDYERRFKAAETELSNAGIWPSNAIPLCTRVLHRIGLKPVPPHYVPLWRSFLSNTLFFTVLLGAVSISGGSIPGGRTPGEFLVQTVVIGSALGLGLVGYYAYGRRRHALSRWSDL
ncbi:DUF6404 family protein [Tateyamaria sp. SN3-11]|uniref:DUF6404 family protein n=1 Tax=Tateyamaria sp. SN3-11 TaxID=3092147 RepID=UPI0039ECB329